MKLNNTQIDALASKIKDELELEHNTPINKSNDKIKNSDAYINFIHTNKDCLEIKKIFLKYKLDDYYEERIYNDIKNKFFSEKLINKKDFNWDTIRNSIILNTIECDNLDAIIEKIKKEFSK